MSKFFEYLKDQRISFNVISDTVADINGETYQFVSPIKGKHFSGDFELIHEDCGYDYIVVFFGGRYYFMKSDEEIKLNELKYIGVPDFVESTGSFLGIHGGYEILVGTRSYDDWIEKAKWMGIDNLGICEKNTLAGTLKFQQVCESENINPIIGATFTVEKECEFKYDLKLYVQNDLGWLNLLEINYLANVVGKLKESDVLRLSDGLFLIIDPKCTPFDKVFPIDLSMDVFWQFDTVEFADPNTDLEYLNNLKDYLESEIKPIAICDAYYLDKEDGYIRNKLSEMSGVFDDESTGQYLKSKEDFFLELSELFNIDDDRAMDIYYEAVQNEHFVADRCEFKINTNDRHLPEYEMTKDEVELYGSNNNMFWSLIEDGLQKLYPDYTDEHVSRVELEVEVLEMGNVVDYFLTTRDIINAATKEGILSGLGRGSAGGSIVSYLLGIIKIDPILFKLIFERFLNKGRVTSSLPDIDSDFEGAARPWVKEYMENRFGKTQVCSVGTYTTMQLKGAIKDVFRTYHTSTDHIKEVNIATSCLDGLEDKTMTDLFKKACKEPRLYKFIHKYPYVFSDLPLVLGMPKAQSVHACAMIITPNEKPQQHWFPIYKNKDGMLMSAWEGGELDEAGFLKQDILGIKQLDKFKSILKRIEMNGKDVPDIYNLPLDDADVYRYFSKGWNGDVFQFGTSGLTGYSRKLKPSNIDDLIACVALYRPGAMENGFHEDYIKRKRGEEDVTYMWGTEKILNTTYGLVVYQEQVMRMCTDIAGFNLVVADDIRKAMGKKKLKVLLPYKEKFINGAVGNGCPKESAEEMWEIMLEFSKYAFNLSHSAAYAVTGYIGQYLKVHYPLEYWATALSFADEDHIPLFLSEIKDTGQVKILPPEINHSGVDIGEDSGDSVYWALSSIKGIAGRSKADPNGGKAVVQITKDRDENGSYDSLDNFLERNTFKGSKVNKTVIEGLILAGAFDKVENINLPQQRINLLNFYWEKCKVKIDIDKHWYHKNIEVSHEEYPWLLKQKNLSGLAFFNYTELISESLSQGLHIFSRDELSIPINKPRRGAIGGVVIEAIERKTRNGDKFAKVLIETNYSMYNVMIWSDTYDDMEFKADELEGGILLLSGEAKFETKYSGANQIQTVKDSRVKFFK